MNSLYIFWNSFWRSVSRDEKLVWVVCVLVTGYCVGINYAHWKATPPLPALFEEAPNNRNSGKTKDFVQVHVIGAVRKSGVFVLPAGARVVDALDRAGGALPEANSEALNLAAKIQDGQQIELLTRQHRTRVGWNK